MCMQVKQFVAELDGAFGTRWQVFRTGDDAYYLFVCKQNSDFQVPVHKTSLSPGVRRALAHGAGHA